MLILEGTLMSTFVRPGGISKATQKPYESRAFAQVMSVPPTGGKAELIDVECNVGEFQPNIGKKTKIQLTVSAYRDTVQYRILEGTKPQFS